MNAGIRKLVLTGVALALGFAAPAAAQQGALNLTDRRLAAGETVRLTGAQFPPAAALSLALEGPGGRTALGSVTAGPAGAFSESLRVPARLTSGAYRLVARSGGTTVASLDVAVVGDSAAAPMAGMSHDAAAPRPAAGDSNAPMAGMSHTAASPRAARTDSGGAAPMAGMTHDSAPAAADSGSAAPAPNGRQGWSLLGYDWPRLHAALNDMPAALLMVALLFEIGGLALKKPSLRWASFWTLLAGLAGMIPAVIAGLMAEDLIDHDDIGHAIMQRHKTLALITLGVFAVLALWRVVRRKSEHRAEGTAWCLAATGGVALLIVTSQLGGKLMFDHAMGIPSTTLVEVLEQRGAMPATQHQDSAGTDSTTATPLPAARPHRDAPGVAPHSHSKRP